MTRIPFPEDVDQTERRYPRSLADAFPDVRAPALEVPHPATRSWRQAHVVIYLLGIVVAIGLIACNIGRPV